MFGYVRPCKPELLVREYSQYKAVYCELCRVLGKEYGFSARFALSYDCAFYALLALSLAGARVEEHRGRCVCNPLKRCTYLPSPGEEYKKAAALCVLLTYHKLRDDVEDKGGLSALGSWALLLLAGPKAKKAAGRYPFLAQQAQEAMDAQRQAEGSGAGVDPCAEPTAQLLQALFGELAGCEQRQRPALEQFGYFLGRWVYLMDAADDLREDLKEGAFNPFIARLGLEGKRELGPKEREEADAACNAALNATAARLALAVNLLELGPFGPIIENVALKGLPQVQREILFLHVKERPRRELEKL
ncbi:DUF5685 family protein [Acutalibacter caecimuris]|uniref:DUF5685 family protein n=1 Tax=Acutalibacter caecimuris TaxID=3093657 RepID=UPI002AC8B909|nr:DUF5685 family protein [Acutalibacter sp. M00118]